MCIRDRIKVLHSYILLPVRSEDDTKEMSHPKSAHPRVRMRNPDLRPWMLLISLMVIRALLLKWVPTALAGQDHSHHAGRRNRARVFIHNSGKGPNNSGEDTLPPSLNSARGKKLNLTNLGEFCGTRSGQGMHMARGKDVAMSLPADVDLCLLYTSPSPRDATLSRMPSSA